jgi:hypothetical protein
MCISNENRSPFTIHDCDTAPTETGFAEIVSDDFPAPFHGYFSSQSFWKAGSARKGSQIGSSLRFTLRALTKRSSHQQFYLDARYLKSA